jgi:glycine/D-amino acid oxidase-like deaminating enzyme
VLTTSDDVESLGRGLDAQRAVGVEAELVTAVQACRYSPWLEPAGIVAAVWSPQAYSCDPQAIVCGYADAARQHGARLQTRAEVTGGDAAGGRVTTTGGDYVAGKIVCAADPWSGQIGAMAGITLPVSPQPSELVTTGPFAMDAALPFTLHLSSELRVRRVGNALLVGLEDMSIIGDQELWRRAVGEEVARRYPGLRDVELHAACTGFLDVAPQWTAFIGRGVGEHERFLYAVGFSGRRLCQAPMTGQIIRDLCLGRQPDTNLEPFSLTRLDLAG